MVRLPLGLVVLNPVDQIFRDCCNHEATLFELVFLIFPHYLPSGVSDSMLSTRIPIPHTC
jgi:hypothetical protein